MNKFSRLVFGLGAASLLTTLSGRADWSIATVDGTATQVRAVSLAIEQTTGVPHLSYRRLQATWDIYYATHPGNVWNTELVTATNSTGEDTSIVLTESGRPVICYQQSGDFVDLRWRVNGSWTAPTTAVINNADNGNFLSMAWNGTDAAPSPVIATHDSTTAAQALWGHYYNGAMWVNTALATDATKDIGSSCSVARASNGAVFGIVAIDEATDTLLFEESTNAGVTWTASHIAFTNKASVCALSYDSNGKAHVIYRNSNTGFYKYATNRGGSWSFPENITSTSSGLNTLGFEACSIAAGTDDLPQVAFVDYSAGALTYAKKAAGGSWAVQTVDATTAGASCSLALDGNNQPRIAYRSTPAEAVKYAEFFTPDPVPLSPSFTISKSKRVTPKSSLVVKGTAVAAVSVEWRVGKKSFKTAVVSGGAWSTKVKPLAPGRNKVQFRAVSASGERSLEKNLTLTRRR